MTTTKETVTLETLEQMMRRHDWLYGFSDDYNVYADGSIAEANLIVACNELARAGHKDEVKQLWDKYCPKEQRKWM
jgi:hypothetical protein